MKKVKKFLLLIFLLSAAAICLITIYDTPPKTEDVSKVIKYEDLQNK